MILITDVHKKFLILIPYHTLKYSTKQIYLQNKFNILWDVAVKKNFDIKSIKEMYTKIKEKLYNPNNTQSNKK